MAFLCLARTTANALAVCILHRIMMRYFELLSRGGGAATDLSMGLLGDVRAAQIPTAEVDNSLSLLVGAGGGVHLPTSAVMIDQLLAALPGSYLEPCGPEDPDTEVVRPRMTQVLSAKYAASLVGQDGISPAMAYRELLGMVAADQALEASSDVLTWLRVACTARGGAGELAPLPAVANTFTLLLLPGAVSNPVAAKVLTDLPSQQRLGGETPSGGPDPVTAAVQRLAKSMGGIATRGEREPRSMREAYRETYILLLRHFRVATVKELAPIWGCLQQSMLQQELSRVCAEWGLLTDV